MFYERAWVWDETGRDVIYLVVDHRGSHLTSHIN